MFYGIQLYYVNQVLLTFFDDTLIICSYAYTRTQNTKRGNTKLLEKQELFLSEHIQASLSP
jgi:hypothetical protein